MERETGGIRSEAFNLGERYLIHSLSDRDKSEPRVHMTYISFLHSIHRRVWVC